MSERLTVSVDLGKSRCRVRITGNESSAERAGTGAPGLAASGGVQAAASAIMSLLEVENPRSAGVDVVSVGAAGAWLAPQAGQELANHLAGALGSRAVVTSDVVTAHAGALDGAPGALLIAGTGAAALGIETGGARLIDGWGPELGDFGSGSWLGREALRALLRTVENGTTTALTEALADAVGSAADVQGWLAQEGPLPRRLATLAPFVLNAAALGDRVARDIALEAVRLLTTSATASSPQTREVALHGGLTDHVWFRGELISALHTAGRDVVPSAGDALDGALLIAHRTDLPHERFVHRAG